MEFLKADVDLRLLLLLSVVLIIFVGSGIYYQNIINNMQEEYDKKIENLKAIEEKLSLKEKKLNEISELKDVLEKDKETLEIGYLSLQSENLNLAEKPSSVPFGKTLCKATGNVQCLG